MFRDREDGALQLAARLAGRKWVDPLVLAIPSGGIVTGAVLARELGAELDVILSCKLRAPFHPEAAIGAVAEGGAVYLNPELELLGDDLREYLALESSHQFAEIARRKRLFRSVRPAAPIADRSVIVTDDGIATGSTMFAALQTVRAQSPRELIVAVPVSPPDRLDEIRKFCDEVVCLQSPPSFRAVGQFYLDFQPVEDNEVVELLRSAAAGRPNDSALRQSA